MLGSLDQTVQWLTRFLAMFCPSFEKMHYELLLIFNFSFFNEC